MADSLQPTYLIEAALLTSPQPLKLESLVKLLDGSLKKAQVLELLAKLEVFWRSRGLRLVETAEGWRFQSTAEVTQALVKLSGQKPPKYSRAVLETLAIIAYRQPATRGDIEEIRGVAVNANVMRQLEERGWIEVVGHRETPGRPSLFGTTKQFLTDLGLKSLAQLPPLAGAQPQVQEFELDLPDPQESVEEPAPEPLQAADSTVQSTIDLSAAQTDDVGKKSDERNALLSSDSSQEVAAGDASEDSEGESQPLDLTKKNEAGAAQADLLEKNKTI